MDEQIPQSPSFEPVAPVVEPPPPPRPPARNPILFGPYGVRAGWKVLLFFVLQVLFGMALSPLFQRIFAHQPKASPIFYPVPATESEFLQVLMVFAATWLMARFVDRQPWDHFGIPWRTAFGRNFWIGATTGLAALTLQLGIMHLAGWFDFGSLQLHGAAILHYGLLWAAMFLLVGFAEEGLLRGYPQRVLTDGMGFWGAAVLLSVLFASLHLGNKGENPFGIFMVFIDGMVMCFSVYRSGTLWWAIGNHAAWDWGMTYLFGTPNSGTRGFGALMLPSFHGPELLAGGSAGPEGSILVLLSEGIFVLVIAWLYPRRTYPLRTDDPPHEAAPAPEPPALAPEI